MWALLAALPALLLAGPACAQAQVLQASDLSQPVALAPDQGAILVGIRRTAPGASRRDVRIALARFDAEGRTLLLPDRSELRRRDGPNWFVNLASRGKSLPFDLLLIPVTAGDWVLYGAQAEVDGRLSVAFCFGAPVVRVNPGEVAYFGDLTPFTRNNFWSARNQISEPNIETIATAWSSDPEGARARLAERQPGLSPALRPADMRNGATFPCALLFQRHFLIPGIPELGAS